MTLAALALYERSRVLGTLAWIYMALIMVASIMLGWHYSLDGYVAVLGTAACWVAAGWLTTPIPDGSRRTATWREPQPGIGAGSGRRPFELRERVDEPALGIEGTVPASHQ